MPSTRKASTKLTMAEWVDCFMIMISLMMISFFTCLATTICLIATFLPVRLSVAEYTAPDALCAPPTAM